MIHNSSHVIAMHLILSWPERHRSLLPLLRRFAALTAAARHPQRQPQPVVSRALLLLRRRSPNVVVFVILVHRVNHIGILNQFEKITRAIFEKLKKRR